MWESDEAKDFTDLFSVERRGLVQGWLSKMIEGLAKGSMHVYVGCTKSGKSSHLVDLLTRFRLKRQICGYFQAKKGEKGMYVEEPSQIFEKSRDLPILLIDNVHLLDQSVAEILPILRTHKHIYVAGEELTPYGLAYPHMGKLLCHADDITKLSAVCTKCGADARYTFLRKLDKQTIAEPRCYHHWQKRSL